MGPTFPAIVLERLFKLSENKTTARIETLAA